MVRGHGLSLSDGQRWSLSPGGSTKVGRFDVGGTGSRLDRLPAIGPRSWPAGSGPSRYPRIPASPDGIPAQRTWNRSGTNRTRRALNEGQSVKVSATPGLVGRAALKLATAEQQRPAKPIAEE